MENLGGIVNPTYDLRPEGTRPDAAQTLLRLNTILQGEVLEMFGGGSIVLGVGGHRVPADTQAQLQLGQKFLFQVQQNEGKIVLKILPEPPPQQSSQQSNSFQLFQQGASKDAPLGETLGKLAHALLTLVGESTDPQASASSPRLPGKSPLDAATIGFLRETAVALQEEIRAEWPAPQTAAKPSPQTLPASPLLQALTPPTILLAAAPPPSNPAPAAATLPQSLPEGAGSPPNPQAVASQLPLLVAAGSPDAEAPQTPAQASLPAVTPPSSAEAMPADAKLPQLAVPRSSSLPLGVLKDLIVALQRPELREAIVSLAKHIEKGAVHDSPRPESIRQHVEETGIPIESNLRRLVEGESRENPEALGKKDLKTLLLRVEGKIEDTLRRLGDKAQPELRKALSEFGDQVKNSRESVESKQVQNALRQDSGEALHFQIPYHDLGRLKTADLYYDRRREKERKGPGGERTVHHLVFLLDMSKLGKLRVDALLRGSRIQIAVNTGDETSAAFLRARLSSLQGALEGLGFEVGLLECRSGLARAVSADRAEFDLPVLGERHIVDLEG